MPVSGTFASRHGVGYLAPRILVATWIGVASLLSFCATATADESFSTEYVVLVCIDGIRNEEAFKNTEATPLGQVPAMHPHIPRIWSEIAPLATVFLNCVNLETTYTTPGFNAILSGAWQFGPNRSRRDDGGFFNNRSLAPTLFEYYSSEMGGESWGVLNKKNTLLSDFSLHPLYGRNPDTNFIFLDPGRGAARYVSDRDVYTQSIQVLENEQPDFFFVNFGSVDLAGHSRNWQIYADSIKSVDGYVGDLWAYIQASPHYQGRTTMVLTTDHGRHDDEHGGFVGHGGMCVGCRDLIALVIGPDTPQGIAVDRLVHQTDFAPTIGRLLGFKTPFAEGRVLSEAIVCAAADGILDQRMPKVASDGSSVFLAYERTRFGNREMHLAVSRDAGKNYTQDVNLTPLRGSGLYGLFSKDPTILVNRRNARDLLHISWLDLGNAEGRLELRHSLGDLTDFQSGARLVLRPSTVIGSSLFEGERRMPSFNNAGLIMQSPHLASVQGPNGRREIIVTAGHRYSMGFRFSDQAFPADEVGNIKSSYPDERYFFTEPRLAAGEGNDVFVIWRDIFESTFTDTNGDQTLEPLFNWEIYLSRSRDGGETWEQPPVRITQTAGASLFPRLVYLPERGFNPAQLLAVYSEPDADGIYQIYLARGVFVPINGQFEISFAPAVAMSNSSVGAWYPEIVVGRPISGSHVHLTYTDFGIGQGDILYRFSDDGTQFFPSLNVSNTPTISQRSSLAVLDDGTKVAAWEELNEVGTATLGTKTFRQKVPVVTR